MKMPSFFKTIRFRLTLWYSAFLVLTLAALVVGLNVAMVRSQQPPQVVMPRLPGDTQSWQQALEEDRLRNIQNLRNYSLIGAGAVLVLGVAGGYFLSSRMLQPVDRVSSLAGRISQANLRERINYQSSNDEIKRLADTFDGMLARLENSFEAQKQFIQDASHELRTPIAIAQTNIEVLEMNGQATPADYRHLVDVIKLSLERMTAINNSLLLLSEGAPTRARRSRVDMAELIGEVLTETQARAVAAGVELQADLPQEKLAVMGDALRLKQAIVNLVDNAIKYNRQGGRVSVAAAIKEERVVAEVRDTGIGMAPEDLSRVFDRFYRAEKSRSRAAGGSGLGLAIVKKIVEDHNGAVSVESVMDKGSVFRISLPHHSA